MKKCAEMVKTAGLQYKRPKSLYTEEHRYETSTEMIGRAFDIITTGPAGGWAEGCEEGKDI